MKVAGIITFSVLLCFSALVESSSSDGFHYVAQALPKFETKYGAFRFTETDDKVSLEATAHALFLANLLGLNNQIDITAVTGFLQSICNPDHGYSQLPGYSSDLESVRQAVLSYQRLGQAIPDHSNIASYIHSLLHKDSNLFGNRVGEKGDLKSTAYAFQVLHLLDLEPHFLQTVSGNIPQYLKSNLKETMENKHFAFTDFGPINGNYYGILLALYSGYDFGDVEKWTSYIASFQSKEGGFYADAAKTIVSLEATANALSSLQILRSHSKTNANFIHKINVDKLASYIHHIPRNLKQASYAHLINAIARPTAEFQVSIDYESVQSNGITESAIVQGAHVKPVVTTPNPALSVEVDIITAGTTKNLKLRWRNGQYSLDEFFDLSDLLGKIDFVFTIRSFALETGVISAIVTDTKYIGYNIAVTSQGYLGGREISAGDSIGAGAQLSFSLALSTLATADISSGDFDVVFSVLDSSAVPIHTQSISGKGNSRPFNFEYTLDSSNIPSGDLVCRFEVKNANQVHSVRNVVYNIDAQLIATEISFKGFTNKAPVYKIGETVEVSFVPATFVDGKVQELRTEVSGKELSQRHFELDIRSRGGVSLHRVKGVAQKSEGKTRYVFKFPLAATLDSIGTKVVSFMYVSASGEAFNLGNYNSAPELSFSVDTELHITDLQEKPSSEKFYYGELITLVFKVKDTNSGKLLSAGDLDSSNVYLYLNHQTGPNNAIVSSHQAAISDGEVFTVSWNINANAIHGSGILGVSVQDADGNSFPILKEASKEEFGLKAEIEGNIEYDSSVLTASHVDSKETALVAHFTLKCRNQLLRDAQLRAFVSFVGDSSEEILFQTSVATDEAGYEVSFSLPHEWVRTGEYKIRVYREADKFREDVSPLLEISHRLEASENALPVRTEFVILLAFISAFAALNVQKSQY